MVERIEGFCSENDWQRAYNEINEFEKDLTDWGAIVVKFTDEDRRNREKWDVYETAINEMLEKTNTTFAPWHVIESNDKKYARIKTLAIVIEEIKQPRQYIGL